MENNHYSSEPDGKQRKIGQIISPLLFTIIIAVGLLCMFAAYSLSHYADTSPFQNDYTWAAPSYVYSGGGASVVIDTSKTRVTVLNSSNEITAVINGGSRDDDAFYYAEYAVTDGKYVYIGEVLYQENGVPVARERILRYSIYGTEQVVLYSLEHSESDMPLQYGEIKDLCIYNGKLYGLLSRNGLLRVFSLNAHGSFSGVRTETLPEDTVWNMAYDAAADRVYLISKRGVLYEEQAHGGGFSQMKLPPAAQTKGTLLSDIAVSGARVLCTDLGHARLIDVRSGEAFLGYDGSITEAPIYYRLSGSQERICTTDNAELVILNPDGQTLLRTSTSQYDARFIALRILAWLTRILFYLCLAFVVFVAVRALILSNRTKAMKATVLLAVTIIVCTVFTSSEIFKVTFDRLSDSTMSNLMQTAKTISTISGKTFGDSLCKIDALEDYGGEDYSHIRSYLDPYCDAAYENGSNMYYILYQERDGMLYGIMDYEDTVSVIYPYCAFAGSGYDEVAQTGEVMAVADETNAYGSWSYVISPVFNSGGDIVGILEIGLDLYSEKQQNKALVSDIAVSTAVMVLVLILILTEGSMLENAFSFRKNNPDSTAPVFLRPIVFLTFLAANFASAFMPMLSSSLNVESSLGLSASLGSALPMSLELLCIALLALAGGYLIERFGLKPMLIASVLVQLAGYILTALAVHQVSYIMLLAGRVLTGSGMGVCIVAYNSMPDQAHSDTERNRLFSDLNAGLISGVVVGSSVGAYIAQYLGYSMTFVASAIIMVPILGLVAITVSAKAKAVQAAQPEGEGDSQLHTSLWRFLLNRRVLAFLICVMAPFLIIMYFKDYMYPLFINEQGYSDNYIGNILLFSGAISIYLGPPITDWLFKRIRETGMIILSGILYALCALAFSFLQTATAATVCVFVISLVAGFGLSAQGIYISTLPAFRRVGANRAMSVYTLWDNISQTVGPMLFAALIGSGLGYGKTNYVLGVGTLVLLGAFLLIGLKKERKTDGLPQ